MSVNPELPSQPQSEPRWLSLRNVCAFVLIATGLFMVYGAGFLTDSWKAITTLLAVGCVIALLGVGIYISGRASASSGTIGAATSR
jgi:hypothetical protein